MELTRHAVDGWLAEDIGQGDRTTHAIFGPDAHCVAHVHLNEPGVVSGLAVSTTVFRALDSDVVVCSRYTDGDLLDRCELVRVEGSARAVLGGERLALNILGRMSGVATLTWRYVQAVAGTGVTILDTRKTTPGVRAFEKAAVRHGGGSNHRFGLDDGVLIKDNHIRLAGGIDAALRRAWRTGARVTVECEAISQVTAALAAGADRILLDNMSLKQQREAVALIAGTAETEASGGVTLDNVRAVAETGVDYISIGALTHSARSLNLSLEVRA